MLFVLGKDFNVFCRLLHIFTGIYFIFQSLQNISILKNFLCVRVKMMIHTFQ